ncbi:MAG: hypothetical protein U9O95_08230 [Candidatus Marinimicrobia bacterium]|nr:hypothetical protein [Candidatus Neomarinimicrobiota bacterium]
MKKVISAIVLIMMVIMLEFNLLKSIIPNIYVWVESILAFGILIVLIIWNNLPGKTK